MLIVKQLPIAFVQAVACGNILQASRKRYFRRFKHSTSLRAASRLIGPVCAPDLDEEFGCFFSPTFSRRFPSSRGKHRNSISALLAGRGCVSESITATMFVKYLSLWVFTLVLLQPVSTEDTVNSGNYLIHLCNSGQPGSEASKLQNLLPQLYNGLQKVITDLQLGTASTHGYSAFFKNDSSKAEVLLVYQKMAAGASVALGRGRNIDPISLKHPTFICANNAPETNFLYQYCISTPNTPLMSWTRTELIPLCPLFWTIKKQARLPDCPLVVANTLTPNDDRLLQNQEALLVGSLVHLYHDFFHEDMVVTITDASELSSSESLINPPTYALYYAGECSIFFTLVKQQCS